MINVKNKSKCSGCHACVNACPKQCISMITDHEGFLYPIVDKGKCIECGLCTKVCHMLKPLASVNVPDVYACYNLDEDIRASSSSGGMFTLFAESILDLGGVVFGASFDDGLEVKHICIDNKEDLYKLRGSKYVQSLIGDSYKHAKEILETGRPVLFSGTPCQISGLQLYLGKNYDCLYTQDIVCHGVPSSTLWKAYLRHLELLHKREINTIIHPSFRDKTLGWLNYSVTVHLGKDIVHSEPHRKDVFMRAYLSNRLLRPSCYKCCCKSLCRNSDITLADFWGINKLMPNMFDDKGTSLVFVNTEKGKHLFDKVGKQAVYRETDIRDAIQYNSAAYVSVPRPFNRRKIIKSIDDHDFEALKSICAKRSFFEKVYHKLRRVWVVREQAKAVRTVTRVTHKKQIFQEER